jgi:hypothetical protein
MVTRGGLVMPSGVNFRLAILLAMAVLPGAAQVERATILGTVTDESGSAVQGAAVIVRNTGTASAARRKPMSEAIMRYRP